jgi:hypothetical protein
MKILIIIILILSALIAKLIYSQSSITYDAGVTIDIGTGADVCADEILINGIYTGGGTICNGPLPVTISSFSSAVYKNNVTLSWRTETELNNSGFDVERKTTKEADQWRKIAFVQGSGNSSEPKTYTFDDNKLQTAAYRYRLKQIDFNGNYEYYELENDVSVLPPGSFRVSQNYPNPSNPKSKIDYEIPESGRVTIKLYNMLGQELMTIVNEFMEAGYFTAEFDGSNLASGVYFYRLKTSGFADVKKLILLK